MLAIQFPIVDNFLDCCINDQIVKHITGQSAYELIYLFIDE